VSRSDRSPQQDGELVAAALAALGVERLLLGIHDPAFPSLADEETGRGTPYSDGAHGFLRYVRGLGFTGIQLGPQGIVAVDNPSPYDGTVFSRSRFSIALLPLVRGDGGEPLVSAATLRQIAAAAPDGPRVSNREAAEAQQRALDETIASFRSGRAPGTAGRLASFRQQHREWLERDALYEPLCRDHGESHWRNWQRDGAASPDQRLFRPSPGEEARAQRRRRELLSAHAEPVEIYAFLQLLAHEQHAELRRRAARIGLRLYGDVQIGYSERDAWALRSLFLRGYRMGAPPSRTNPDGQPWNYPVLDPRQYREADATPGPALRMLQARLAKLFGEFDGLRLDHPHGLVCPWVYRSGSADPLHAVQTGARLFAAPELPDHPELAAFAIPTPAQLERGLPRHADRWVRDLDEAQVDRYALLFDAVVAAAGRAGRPVSDLVCEVLSTQPEPLRRVMQRYRLGRFRVTQKANLGDPADVYRGENARPEDWIMVGNHDTPPVWRVAAAWSEPAARSQADYLAGRLSIPASEREAWAARLVADRGALAQAKLADLFVGPARNVMVFFTDLLGFEEPYNRPGVVSEENWTLRVPRDYERLYRERLAAGRAFDIPRALAAALRARGDGFRQRHAELASRLEERAGG